MKLYWSIRIDTPTTKWRRIGYRIAGICFLLAVLIWMSSFLYQSQLERDFMNYPRISTASNSVPYHWKSAVVYVTVAESEALRRIHFIELFVGSLGVVSVIARALLGVHSSLK